MGLTWIDIGVLLLAAVTATTAGLFAFLLWRSGYVRGWRAARDAPPICPACGYNLTGLTQCRCPECGREYRLDQLWRVPIHLDQLRHASGRSTTNEEAGFEAIAAAEPGAAQTQEDTKNDDDDR